MRSRRQTLASFIYAILDCAMAPGLWSRIRRREAMGWYLWRSLAGQLLLYMPGLAERLANIPFSVRLFGSGPGHASRHDASTS